MTTLFFDQPFQSILLNKYCLFRIFFLKNYHMKSMQILSISKKKYEIKTIQIIYLHIFYSCEIINSKYKNFYLRKCSFVKMIFGFLLTTKKEHRLSPLQINLETVTDYTIFRPTLSKHSFK